MTGYRETVQDNERIQRITMDLIVSHRDADFDALSSLIAAEKLYPGARLLLPGSHEKAVRNFMSLFKDKIRIENEKTCRMDDVERLIIVDNRHKSRIGAAADLVDRKGLKIHIYDHHPRTRFDIKADKDVFKEVGATVSLILEILLKEKKFKFTPMEATLMLIGIYEETGSLSYRTTTKLDVDMVSKLLEEGANLSAVSSYLNRELDGDELRTLIDLLESVETVNIDGVDIAFAAADVAKFAGETGTVVHKLQDVENYPVIFAMFRSGDKVKVLARSRIDIVDVNKLLNPLGGAGHSSAASMKVEGKALDDVKRAVIEGLRTMIHPDIYAEDIMSTAVRPVFQEERVSDIHEKFEMSGYKGAPVLDERGELCGIVTLDDLNKAILRGMGHSRVKGYMSVHAATAELGTPLYVLREMIRGKDKGIIPVVRGRKLLGVVTRTDLLENIHASLFKGKTDKKPFNIAEMIRRALPKKMMKVIRFVAKEADGLGINIFLVGGFVRDLMLRAGNYDLDIVVEGDAIGFGRVLSEKMGGTLVTHKKFGTATLIKEWPASSRQLSGADRRFKIDIASARKESYEKPAALPVVKFSSLRQDLFRRDFTINAMAVKINRKEFGLFIDFFRGKEDLEKGIIRALHDKSFIDDPTRIFRAVRFEQRFGFSIEKHTDYLIKHAVRQEMFHRTENQRIRDELILMLKEGTAERSVFRMKELHELRFIHPALALKRTAGNTFREVSRCVRWYESAAANRIKLEKWLINLMVMIDGLTIAGTEEVLGKFVFPKHVNASVRACKARGKAILASLSSSKRLPASTIYALLEPFSHETLIFMMGVTKSKAARVRIRKFFTLYNGISLESKGHDILKEGVPPGPRCGEILKKMMYEKIDGRLPTRQAELKYMRELIRREARAAISLQPSAVSKNMSISKSRKDRTILKKPKADS